MTDSGERDIRSKRMTFTADADDVAELEAIAAEKRVSLSWVIRDCIQAYLKERAPLLHSKERGGKSRNHA